MVCSSIPHIQKLRVVIASVAKHARVEGLINTPEPPPNLPQQNYADIAAVDSIWRPKSTIVEVRFFLVLHQVLLYRIRNNTPGMLCGCYFCLVDVFIINTAIVYFLFRVGDFFVDAGCCGGCGLVGDLEFCLPRCASLARTCLDE